MNSKFVFVIPHYNCVEDIEKTLFSMVSQSYVDWRAIVIDDLSTDGSHDKVLEVTSSLPKRYSEKFTVIKNTRKHGEVENTLQAMGLIEDDEVVCRLDGGDWLTENDLLYVLNQVYQDDSVAVAWTAHRWSYTSQNISGPLNLSPGQSVYQHPWVSSHLKTFRCERLRKVPEANFRDSDGNYIMIACDQAVFLPMMHLSNMENKKLAFVPILGYHYNIDLSNKNLFTNERSLRQKISAETIRQRGFIG